MTKTATSKNDSRTPPVNLAIYRVLWVKKAAKIIKTAMNGEEDHIHILFELPPSAAPSVVICSLKTQLSKEVRKRFGEQIRGKLWKDSFWSDSYFLSTTGGADIETLEKYIQEQGVMKPKRKYVHHKKK